MFVPPANFGLVEDGIYRTSFIDTINYAFVETLSLKSILLLDGEKPTNHFYKFLQKNKIQLYQISHKKSGRKNEDSEGTGQELISEDSLEVEEHVSDDDKSHAVIDQQLTAAYEKNVIYIYNDVFSSNKSSSDDSWMVIKRQLLNKILEIVLDKSKYNLLIVDPMGVVGSIIRKVEKWNYSNLIGEYRLFAGKNKSYQLENFLEIVEIEFVSKESSKSENKRPVIVEEKGDDFESVITTDDDEEHKLNVNKNNSNNDHGSRPKTISSLGSSFSGTRNSVSYAMNSRRESNIFDNHESPEYLQSPSLSYRSPKDIIPVASPENYLTRHISSFKESSYKIRRGSSISNSLNNVNINSNKDSYESSFKSLVPSFSESLTPTGSQKLDEISSSPQIPNNLLRLVELRKKPKQADEDSIDSEEIKLDEDKILKKSISRNSNHHATNLEKTNVSLLSAELAHVKNHPENHNDKDPSPEVHNNKPNEANEGNDIEDEEYEKLKDYFHIFYKSYSKEKYDGIKNCIKVKLPVEQKLPDWFKFQRNLWIKEYLEINGLG